MSLRWYLTLDVNTGGETLHNITLGEWGLTYNLSRMINAAYGIEGRYYDLWENKTGAEIIEGLEQAVLRMEADPDQYKQYNPSNGWGDYDAALGVLKTFLESCKLHPAAVVSTWR